VLPPDAAPLLVELLPVWLLLPLPVVCADACCGTMPIANTDAMTNDEITTAHIAAVYLLNISSNQYLSHL
jgi:hypothetical protein